MDIRSLLSQQFNIGQEDNTWYKIHCPFHSDETPSAGIHFGYNCFNCFSCNQKMSLERFIERINESNNLIVRNKDKKFHLNGSSGKRIELNMSKQIKELVDFLEFKKLSWQTIIECGGSYQDNSFKDYYGHLVFKIDDSTTVARKILDIPGERFQNSPGDKSLLGVDNIKNSNQIILTEGVTDYLTLWELGYRNIVCSLGSSLSKKQAYLLRGKTIFIIYDRDFSGYEGAKQAQQLLKEYKSNAIIIELDGEVGGIDNNGAKCDISSLYSTSDLFPSWLKSSLAKYEESDSSYVRQLRSRQRLNYYPTGIKGLDYALNGGFTQGLYIVGGEPKVGKSTVLNTFLRAFVGMKKRVCLFTYELPIDQCWARYASTYSEHSWVEIEKDSSILEDPVIEQLELDAEYLKITSDPSIEEIVERLRHYDIGIFDYLQQMPSAEDNPNVAIQKNNKMFSQVTRAGKTLIVVSSLSRAGYRDEEGMGIFKGSGDIEYTMQAGMRLYKTAYDKIFCKFVGNTRGREWQGYLRTDWSHQTIKEIDE